MVGVLGIRRLITFNSAFVGKWLWWYINECDSLYRQVTDEKYGNTWGGWCSNEVYGSYVVGLWKYIRQMWGQFSQHINFEAGDVSKIKFWHDVWCKDRPLKVAFTELFSLARMNEASVEDNQKLLNGSLQWEVNFTHAAQNWKVYSFTSFYAQLIIQKESKWCTQIMLEPIQARCIWC